MIKLIATEIVFSFTVLTPTTSSAAVTPPIIESESVNQAYPLRALQERREGTTQYLLTIGVDGSVVDCEVTGPSGSHDLDEATCVALRSARFAPALDRAGHGVIGKLEERMVWRLPASGTE